MMISRQSYFDYNHMVAMMPERPQLSNFNDMFLEIIIG